MIQTGERIRRARTAKKLTQEEMALALNISQRAYSKIENDQVKIKIDRLQEIANLLQTDIIDLIGSNQNQNFEHVTHSQIGNGKVINHTSEKERELFDKIIHRQEQEIEYLKGIINVFKK